MTMPVEWEYMEKQALDKESGVLTALGNAASTAGKTVKSIGKGAANLAGFAVGGSALEPLKNKVNGGYM